MFVSWPAAPAGVPVTAVDQSLVSLALDVGRLTVRDFDVPAVLGRVCSALPAATGAAAAVVLLVAPFGDEIGDALTVVASDGQARWIGEAQRRTGNGPLPGVVRTGRPLLTPDLTRLGPPELAAAAAHSGLTSSLVVPIAAGDERLGGVQLLGTPRRPVRAGQADVAMPLLDILAARLADARALRFEGRPEPVVRPEIGVRPQFVVQPEFAVPSTPPATEVDPGDIVTTAIPAVPKPRRPEPQGRHARPDRPGVPPATGGSRRRGSHRA